MSDAATTTTTPPTDDGSPTIGAELLSVTVVANLFSVTSETVRTWIKNGSLPAVRIPSGRYRVKRSDLKAFAESKFEKA